MTAEAIRTWGRETLTATGMIWKAFFRWVGLIIISATGIGFLIILMSGDNKKIVPAFYSILLVIPVLILFHLNAIVYLLLALLGVRPNYNGALYGAVKWIERKKLYDTKSSAR